MSVSFDVLLTPVRADIVPSATNIVRLLQWFDEKGDFAKKVSAENPLELTYYFEEDDEEEVTFPALDSNLENYLATHQNWDILCSTPGHIIGSTQGYVTPLLQIDIPNSNGHYWLRFIGILCKNLQSWYQSYSDEIPDRNFTISFDSYVFGGEIGAEDHFELASQRLISSGVVAEIENILGIELELHPA